MCAAKGRLWFIAGLVLLGLILAGPLWLEALGQVLITADPLHPADAILVLGGETKDGDRVRHAVTLYKQGLAPMLILSGTPWGFRTHEADVMRNHAEYLGVPADHILAVKHDSDSTLEEAKVLVPLLQQKGFKEVILVTSNYHTARAKRIYAKLVGSAGPRVLASPAKDGAFDPERWWTKRRYAKTWFFEVTKTVWSALEAE